MDRPKDMAWIAERTAEMMAEKFKPILEAKDARIAELEEVLADKRRLVRELDVALCGDGAAKAPALVDVLATARALAAGAGSVSQRIAALEREVERWPAEVCEALGCDEQRNGEDVLEACRRIRRERDEALERAEQLAHGFSDLNTTLLMTEAEVARLRASLANLRDTCVGVAQVSGDLGYATVAQVADEALAP